MCVLDRTRASERMNGDGDNDEQSLVAVAGPSLPAAGGFGSTVSSSRGLLSSLLPSSSSKNGGLEASATRWLRHRQSPVRGLMRGYATTATASGSSRAERTTLPPPVGAFLDWTKDSHFGFSMDRNHNGCRYDDDVGGSGEGRRVLFEEDLGFTWERSEDNAKESSFHGKEESFGSEDNSKELSSHGMEESFGSEDRAKESSSRGMEESFGGRQHDADESDTNTDDDDDDEEESNSESDTTSVDSDDGSSNEQKNDDNSNESTPNLEDMTDAAEQHSESDAAKQQHPDVASKEDPPIQRKETTKPNSIRRASASA